MHENAKQADISHLGMIRNVISEYDRQRTTMKALAIIVSVAALLFSPAGSQGNLVTSLITAIVFMIWVADAHNYRVKRSFVRLYDKASAGEIAQFDMNASKFVEKGDWTASWWAPPGNAIYIVVIASLALMSVI